MPHIVLTVEQAQIIAQSAEPVEVRNDKGQVVATSIRRLEDIDREVIELHKRRQGLPKEPSVPSAVVQTRLTRLEEIRQREGMDEVKMKDLLRQMRAGEQV